jgi:hypothetical protein
VRKDEEGKASETYRGAMGAGRQTDSERRGQEAGSDNYDVAVCTLYKKFHVSKPA